MADNFSSKMGDFYNAKKGELEALWEDLAGTEKALKLLGQYYGEHEAQFIPSAFFRNIASFCRQVCGGREAGLKGGRDVRLRHGAKEKGRRSMHVGLTFGSCFLAPWIWILYLVIQWKGRIRMLILLSSWELISVEDLGEVEVYPILTMVALHVRVQGWQGPLNQG